MVMMGTGKDAGHNVVGVKNIENSTRGPQDCKNNMGWGFFPKELTIPPPSNMLFQEKHSFFCIFYKYFASQIHLILPPTMYKPLRLVETIRNILKFIRKSGVLREK